MKISIVQKNQLSVRFVYLKLILVVKINLL